MTTYKLSYEGSTTTVTSERAAKKWAREQLGAKRLTEAPTATGCQYFNASDNDEMSENAVTVVYG